MKLRLSVDAEMAIFRRFIMVFLARSAFDLLSTMLSVMLDTHVGFPESIVTWQHWMATVTIQNTGLKNRASFDERRR